MEPAAGIVAMPILWQPRSPQFSHNVNDRNVFLPALLWTNDAYVIDILNARTRIGVTHRQCAPDERNTHNHDAALFGVTLVPP